MENNKETIQETTQINTQDNQDINLNLKNIHVNSFQSHNQEALELPNEIQTVPTSKYKGLLYPGCIARQTHENTEQPNTAIAPTQYTEPTITEPTDNTLFKEKTSADCALEIASSIKDFFTENSIPAAKVEGLLCYKYHSNLKEEDLMSPEEQAEEDEIWNEEEDWKTPVFYGFCMVSFNCAYVVVGVTGKSSYESQRISLTDRNATLTIVPYLQSISDIFKADKEGLLDTKDLQSIAIIDEIAKKHGLVKVSR